uniref:Serpin domain-containing protein n=1 Tax=Ditylenchus dipsaci TaxID=166011 RepID=A0A915D2H0_9BILA
MTLLIIYSVSTLLIKNNRANTETKPEIDSQHTTLPYLLNKNIFCYKELRGADLSKFIENPNKSFNNEHFGDAQFDFSVQMLSRLFELSNHTDQTAVKTTLFSPLVLFFNMGVLSAMSSGETRKEVLHNIFQDASQLELEQYFSSKAHEKLSHDSEKVDAAFFSALFLQVKYVRCFLLSKFGDLESLRQKFSDNFTDRLISTYGTHSEFIDFSSNSEANAQHINQMLQSDRNITELYKESITPAQLTSETTSLLLSALSFSGLFLRCFGSLIPRPFYPYETNSGLQRTEFFLYGHHQMLLYENDKLQLIGKPFQDQSFVFFIILPRPNATICKVLESLSGNQLRTMLANFKIANVLLEVPQFNVSTASREMRPVFEDLGVKKAFLSNAELNDLSDQSVAVDSIVHQVDFAIKKCGVTLHVCDKNAILRRLFLGLSELSGSHTGTSIRREVNRILSDFGLSIKDLFKVVTDGASNMANAFRDVCSVEVMIQYLEDNNEEEMEETDKVNIDCSTAELFIQ